MVQSLHTGRLALTPQSPYDAPHDVTALIQKLCEIGFIKQSLDNSDQRYLLGERFLQLITFMGCSPHIRLEPGAADAPFCHLVIDGPSDRPRLIQGRNTTPPRCVSCRKRLPGWQSTFTAWQGESPGWLASCPLCGHRQDPATYDFRQSAGCGRFFLMLENIFPQEAIPSPALLQALQAFNRNRNWRYFYQQV